MDKKGTLAGTPRTPTKGELPFAIPLGERVAKKPTRESGTLSSSVTRIFFPAWVACSLILLQLED